jgi:hypothetical protein
VAFGVISAVQARRVARERDRGGGGRARRVKAAEEALEGLR